jgi:hypothetical protein
VTDAEHTADVEVSEILTLLISIFDRLFSLLIFFSLDDSFYAE